MTTIRRRRTLDSIPPVTCPAALPIAGATPERAGVVCAIMRDEVARTADGVGISPGALAASRDGEGGVLLTAKSDPSTVARLCCGTEMPVIDSRGHYRSSEDMGTRQSSTFCPVWQAEKQRIAEGREQLAGGGREPDPVSHGMPEGDPWGGAQSATLDELTGG